MILSVCPNPSVDKYLHLDTIKAGIVNRSAFEQYYAGGKGVHVALAVNELGIKCSLAGIWAGPTGKWIKESCSNYGVECFGINIDGWNRTCITVNSESNFDQTEILERGPEISRHSIDQFLDDIASLISKTSSICISGSWPAGTPKTIYKELKKNIPSSTHLWIDASGIWLKKAINIKPYGMHVNINEAREIFGTKQTPTKCALELLKYCTVSAVTNGADGLYLARGNELYHATCQVNKIISTVGSGDCLMAGLLSASYKNYDLRKMTVLGTACGTANCLRKEIGMFYLKDVERLQKNVTCKQLR